MATGRTTTKVFGTRSFDERCARLSSRLAPRVAGAKSRNQTPHLAPCKRWAPQMFEEHMTQRPTKPFDCGSSPAGTPEHSPAIDRWDLCEKCIPKPRQGRKQRAAFSGGIFRPSGTHGSSPANPPLNRWAILFRPAGLRPSRARGPRSSSSHHEERPGREFAYMRISRLESLNRGLMGSAREFSSFPRFAVLTPPLPDSQRRRARGKRASATANPVACLYRPVPFSGRKARNAAPRRIAATTTKARSRR